MRAVLVAALAIAVALHTGSALANQKRKFQDANDQYDNLATQACSQLDCSSASNSTHPGQFARCCWDYGAGEKLSGEVLVLPRSGGGGGGRGGRGGGGREKVAHDRRGWFGCVLSSLFCRPPPAPQPAPPPAPPTSSHLLSNPHPVLPALIESNYPKTAAALRALLQIWPHVQPEQQLYYSIGFFRKQHGLAPFSPALATLANMYAFSNPDNNPIHKFYYLLGRRHAGGMHISEAVKYNYLLNIGFDLGIIHGTANQPHSTSGLKLNEKTFQQLLEIKSLTKLITMAATFTSHEGGQGQAGDHGAPLYQHVYIPGTEVL